MGYITTFELTVPNAEVYAETVKSLTGYEWYAESSDVLMMQGKWYDWESNMRNLSRYHPLVLFELNGQGEDLGDLWRAYFKGGCMQRIEPTFAAFDPSLLV